MKWLLMALLFPMLAIAQPPQGSGGEQMDPQQYFDRSKEMMLPMIEKSLPAMKETKSCLSKASDQATFTKCVEIMVNLEKEMKMGQGASMPGHQKPQTQQPKEIEFNEKTRQDMLKYLEHSIGLGTALKKCFTSSSSPDQMQSCMQAEKTNSVQ
jgi:hypothetical protein